MAMPLRRHNIITIDVRLVSETAKAYLVESTDTGKQSWVPKSAVELERTGHTLCSLQIEEELAIDKELV